MYNYSWLYLVFVLLKTKIKDLTLLYLFRINRNVLQCTWISYFSELNGTEQLIICQLKAKLMPLLYQPHNWYIDVRLIIEKDRYLQLSRFHFHSSKNALKCNHGGQCFFSYLYLNSKYCLLFYVFLRKKIIVYTSWAYGGNKHLAVQKERGFNMFIIFYIV